MSLPRFVLVACCSLIAARGAATDLLLPGDYHGDEITAEDGTTWFALVQDEHGGARLEARRVGIESVNDPVLDAEDGATGKRVGAGQDDVLFYLRDLPGVASGPVATAYAGNGDPLSLAGLDRSFLLFDRGAAVPLELAGVSASIRDRKKVTIDVSVGSGSGSATVWGCDLSYEYVKVNAEYTT